MVTPPSRAHKGGLTNYAYLKEPLPCSFSNNYMALLSVPYLKRRWPMVVVLPESTSPMKVMLILLLAYFCYFYIIISLAIKNNINIVKIFKNYLKKVLRPSTNLND